MNFKLVKRPIAVTLISTISNWSLIKIGLERYDVNNYKSLHRKMEKTGSASDLAAPSEIVSANNLKNVKLSTFPLAFRRKRIILDKTSAYPASFSLKAVRIPQKAFFLYHLHSARKATP